MNDYPRYASNRESGIEWVGKCPSHWQVEPFFKYASQCKHSNKGMVNDNLLSLSYGRIVRKDIASVEGLLPESYETYQIVEPDDVVFRLTDLQNDKHSLRSAQCTEEGIITSAYLAVRPTGIYPAYLAYLMRAYDLTKVFYSLGSGLRQSLKYSEMKRLPLLFPPPNEQTQIAKFLDYETAKIDALIAKQQQLIALLQEKRQAIISHAVTKGLNPAAPLRDSGVEWLGKVPAHWEVAPLKHHIQQFDQGWSPQCEQRPAGKGEWGVMKVGCVNGGVFNRNENKCLPNTLIPQMAYALRKGDLLISRANTRELVGSAAVVLEDEPNLQLCDKLYRLRLGSVPEAQFISHYFETSLTRQQLELEATGASHSMQNITQDTIRNLPVPIPPLQEVNEIVAELKRKLIVLDSTMIKGMTLIDTLQERRTALISAAVTGKIDVRGWQPPLANPAGAMP